MKQHGFQRILSWVLVLCLTLSLAPFAALAAGETNLLANGDFEADLAGGKWTFLNSNVTAERVTENPQSGQYCLKITDIAGAAKPGAYDVTYSSGLRLSAGRYRISFYMKKAKTTAGETIQLDVCDSVSTSSVYYKSAGLSLRKDLSVTENWTQFSYEFWVLYYSNSASLGGQPFGINFRNTGTHADTNTYYLDNVSLVKLSDEVAVSSVAPALGSTLAMDWTVTTGNTFTDPTVAASFLGQDAASETLTSAVYDKSNAKHSYSYRVKGILPQYMNDKMTFTAKLSETVLATQEYSLMDAISHYKETSQDENLLALLGAMEQYCLAAQVYSEQGTPLEGVEKNIPTVNATAIDKLLDGNNTGAVAWKSAALVLRDQVALRLKFTADNVENLTVTALDQKYTADNMIPAGEGVYYIDVPVAPNQYSEDVEAVFNDGEGAVLHYNVETYISRQLAKNDANESLTDLLKTLYDYGTKAAAYAS